MPTISCPGTTGSRGHRQFAVDDVQVGAAHGTGANRQTHLAAAGHGSGRVSRASGVRDARKLIARIALAGGGFAAAVTTRLCRRAGEPTQSIDTSRLPAPCRFGKVKVSTPLSSFALDALSSIS